MQRLLLKAVDAARNGILHQRFARAEEIPKLAACPSKIRLHLFLVGGRDLLDRLPFQDDLLLNEDVRTESLVESDPLVFDRNRNLLFYRETTLPQPVDKDRLIDCLEQSGSTFTMNCDGCLHHNRADLVFRPFLLCVSTRIR